VRGERERNAVYPVRVRNPERGVRVKRGRNERERKNERVEERAA